MSDFKDQDAVERVLSGLRGVQARDGLERRVLAGVAARLSARRLRRRQMGWSLVTVVLAVGVWVGAWHGRTAVPGKRVVAASPRTLPAVKDVPAGGRGAPRVTPVAGSQAVSEVARRASGGLREEVQASERPVLSEASFPAPPLPLTEEERLLRIAARHGVTQELAVVPVSRLVPEDAQYRAQLQEFEDFFYVPPYVEPQSAAPAASTTKAGQPGENTGGL